MNADRSRPLNYAVISAAVIEDELNEYTAFASKLAELDPNQAEVDAWTWGVTLYITARRSETAAQAFAAKGEGMQPRSQLLARMVHIQDDVLPEVRAGDWTRKPVKAPKPE